MIFLTVGTLFPFDRLVKAVDDFVETNDCQQIFAQIGKNGYTPKNFPSKDTLSKDEYDAIFMKASHIISHAGMGSIIMALRTQKPILVMPRLRKFHEAVNDHQLHTAKKFEQLGHVVAAYHPSEIPQKIRLLDSFTPRPRKCQPDKVAAHIGNFLHSLS